MPIFAGGLFICCYKGILFLGYMGLLPSCPLIDVITKDDLVEFRGSIGQVKYGLLAIVLLCRMAALVVREDGFEH